jgi:hypothetical protein
VAWINAEDLGGVLAGLAAVAAGLGLVAGQGNAEAAGRAVRHRLETGGDRCLLVFDNATDPAVLQPFLPAAGAARVIITTNQRSMANLGAGVPVDVFPRPRHVLLLIVGNRKLQDIAIGPLLCFNNDFKLSIQREGQCVTRIYGCIECERRVLDSFQCESIN